MQEKRLQNLITVSTTTESPPVIEVDPLLLERLEVDRQFQAVGYFVGRINDEVIDNVNTLLQRLAQVFEFPSYFGFNWNALKDCLADMSWRPAQGYILIFPHPEGLGKQDLQDLFDIARAVSSLWLPDGIPFKLLVPEGTLQRTVAFGSS
ncbi:MAG: barstar family protein [Anaerolineae bacterium]